MIKKLISKFFGLDKYSFNHVKISKETLVGITQFALESHPREFIMFLQGKVKNKELLIEGLVFQEYYANEDSAMPMIRLPMVSGVVGSVHSHPGISNKPSDADLHFFSKHGFVHLIIKKPYGVQDIAAYDKNGKRIGFEIYQ